MAPMPERMTRIRPTQASPQPAPTPGRWLALGSRRSRSHGSSAAAVVPALAGLRFPTGSQASRTAPIASASDTVCPDATRASRVTSAPESSRPGAHMMALRTLSVCGVIRGSLAILGSLHRGHANASGIFAAEGSASPPRSAPNGDCDLTLPSPPAPHPGVGADRARAAQEMSDLARSISPVYTQL
jgi:hypothetical protein